MHSVRCQCSDEIYANSIFKPDSQFTSVAVLAANPQEHDLPREDVRSYVHVMFGLSKDWCASGLRVGCLWTLNAPVQNATQNLSYFCAVSGIAQHMLADMLEDTAFVKEYVKENLRRLGAAYDTLAGLPRPRFLFQFAQGQRSLKMSSDHQVLSLPCSPCPGVCSRQSLCTCCGRHNVLYVVVCCCILRDTVFSASSCMLV